MLFQHNTSILFFFIFTLLPELAFAHYKFHQRLPLGALSILFLMMALLSERLFCVRVCTVSYTHLDVYKRQYGTCIYFFIHLFIITFSYSFSTSASKSISVVLPSSLARALCLAIQDITSFKSIGSMLSLIPPLLLFHHHSHSLESILQQLHCNFHLH